jgi:hypothetical protein
VPLFYNDSNVAVLLGNGDGTLQGETDVILVNGSITYYSPQYITLAGNGSNAPAHSMNLTLVVE